MLASQRSVSATFGTLVCNTIRSQLQFYIWDFVIFLITYMAMRKDKQTGKGKRHSQALSVARRMAGKKGAVVQLQTEVNTDEEWEKIVSKEGLLVVDVYSEWCGPCVGMVGTLKKLKLEIGGDLLNLAIAKADTIESLKRFRNKSEPTWMFIGSGNLVNLMFGANAPRLSKLIIQELEQEAKALRGERERVSMPFDEPTEEENIRNELKERKRQITLAKEAAELEISQEKERKRKLKTLTRNLRKLTIVLYMPHMLSNDPEPSDVQKEVQQQLEAEMLRVREEFSVNISPAVMKQLFCKDELTDTDEPNVDATIGQCKIELFEEFKTEDEPTHESSNKGIPDIVEVASKVIYGDSSDNVECEVQEPLSESIASKWMKEGQPALWTPKTSSLKVMAMKMLLPDLVDELQGPTEDALPPHAVLVFEATKYKEMADCLEENQLEVLKQGFFDKAEPSNAHKIANTFAEFQVLPNKTGSEKFVIALNTTKSDALLTLSQYLPSYISATPEDGEKDSEAFFAEEDDDDVCDIEVDQRISDDLNDSVKQEDPQNCLEPEIQ